ncbi:MAG: FHA domain-containing protein [Spirochaetota bacterium]
MAYPAGYPEISLSARIEGCGNDLTEEDLSLFENGSLVENFTLSRDFKADDTLYLVISLDSSRSINNESFTRVKTRILELLTAASGKDKIGIYRFDDDVLLIEDFTLNKTELARRVDSVSRHGSKTLLYNAVYDGIEKLQRCAGEKNELVVFTDGKDEGSSLSADDVISFAKEAGISLNFIGLKKAKTAVVLKRMARLTGGVFIPAEEKGSGERMYRLLSKSGPAHYTVTYRSSGNNEGLNIPVELRLKKCDIRDRSSISVQYPEKKKGSVREIDSRIVIALSSFLAAAVFILLLLFFRKQKILPRLIRKKFPREPSPDICTPPRYQPPEEIPAAVPEIEKTLTPEDEGFDYCRAWLMQKDGPETGKKYPLYWNEITIGRGKQNGIVINDPTVSSDHAKIRLVKKSYYLFDLVSENGTYLNGNKLLRPKPVHDWDEIRIGRTLFIFRGIKRS